MADTIREVIHPTRVRLEGKVLSADVGGVDIASAREEHGLDEKKALRQKAECSEPVKGCCENHLCLQGWLLTAADANPGIFDGS